MRNIDYSPDSYIQWETIYESYDEAKNISYLPNWFKEFLKNIGTKYKTEFGRKGTLIGMSETNEDFYYVLKDSNEEFFETCVSKLIRV